MLRDAARPENIERYRSGGAAQPEVQRGLVHVSFAGSKLDFAQESTACMLDADLGADGVAVHVLTVAHQFHLEPVVAIAVVAIEAPVGK